MFSPQLAIGQYLQATQVASLQPKDLPRHKNLALRDQYNKARIIMGISETWGIHECVRGVAVGYHEPDIFEKCWSTSFMSGKADIAEFPGGWSVSVPTDWDGLNLDQRSRVIAADIISWAEETTPPRMAYSDLAKIQLLA